MGQLLNINNHLAYLFGFSDSGFQPDEPMTRAQAAQLFYNLLLEQEVPVQVSFTDVPQDKWYSDAVNCLASLGIMGGVGHYRFQPGRNIARAEFSATAMRFAKATDEGQVRFTDVDEKDWFYTSILGAVDYGWIGGYPDGSFKTNDTIIRAEAAAIVNRMLDRQADVNYAEVHPDELKFFSDVPSKHWAYPDVLEATNGHTYGRSEGRKA